MLGGGHRAEDFGWCAPAQDLAGAVVEPVGEVVEVLLVVVRRSSLRARYWRSSRLVFSLVPRCHGLLGSQK